MALYQLTCEKENGRQIVHGMRINAPLEPVHLRRLAAALNRRFIDRRYRVELVSSGVARPVSEYEYTPADFQGSGYYGKP